MGIVEKQGNRNIEGVFERIRDEAIEHMEKTMPMEAIEWFRCNFKVNVTGRKLNHIMSVLDFVEILRGRALSDDEYFKATVLEWCIMLLEASRLHVYSNGQSDGHRQCWYAGDDIIIKDSLWLDVVMYYLLRKYFRSEMYYVHLLELFHDTTFQMISGQLVNLVTTSKGHFDFAKFSLQRHSLISRKRVTNFYLPVAVAMCICGVPESYYLQGRLFSPYATARSILFRLAEYCQIQDDFLNWVSTVEGKSRTDVMQNKCSWCINVALAVASPRQREVLEDNYGQKDWEKEMRVKEVYEAIGLREQYRVYESSLQEQIKAMIAEVPEPEGNMVGEVLKREVFTSFFDKVCERMKC